MRCYDEIMPHFFTKKRTKRHYILLSNWDKCASGSSIKKVNLPLFLKRRNGHTDMISNIGNASCCPDEALDRFIFLSLLIIQSCSRSYLYSPVMIFSVISLIFFFCYTVVLVVLKA